MLHITCNMCTRDLPDMYALSPRACGPQALGIHIRQIPRAHVTTITCNMCTRDLPDMYALSLRPLGFGHTYQANPLCPCYNYYMLHFQLSKNLPKLDVIFQPLYIIMRCRCDCGQRSYIIVVVMVYHNFCSQMGKTSR